MGAHLRGHDRSAVEEHLRNRDKNAATRERTLSEAQARAKARAAGVDVRTDGYIRRGRRRGNRRQWIIVASLISVVLIGAVIVPPFAGGIFRALAEANPDLMRFGAVADAVGAVMDDRPDKPAGTDPATVEFVIDPGQSSAEITDALVARDLVTDRLAFTYVLVTDGGLNELQAGSHTLSRTMSPREVARVLQGAPGPGGTGCPSRCAAACASSRSWLISRRCRSTTSISSSSTRSRPARAMPAPEIPVAERHPGGSQRRGLPRLGRLQRGARHRRRDDARDAAPGAGRTAPRTALIAEAQANGQGLLRGGHPGQHRRARGDPRYGQAAHRRRLPEPSRRPGGRPRTLNSEPTSSTPRTRSSCATSTSASGPTTSSGRSTASARRPASRCHADLACFQVWHSRGLPPWPICSPGLASLEAALQPDTADGYLYFLAKGDGSNGHVFAKTYEEHLPNIEPLLGTPEPVDIQLPGMQRHDRHPAARTATAHAGRRTSAGATATAPPDPCAWPPFARARGARASAPTSASGARTSAT